MMWKFAFIVYLSLNSFHVLSQRADNKHLAALLYIKSQQDINRELKDFFKKDISKQICFIPIRVFKQVMVADIKPFYNELNLNRDDLGFDLDSIFNRPTHGYEFIDSLDTTIFRGLLAQESPSLFLTFGIPIGNILPLEITNVDPNLFRKIKIGKGVCILLLFGEDGSIKKIFKRKNVYN